MNHHRKPDHYLAARLPFLSLIHTDGGVVKELLDQTRDRCALLNRSGTPRIPDEGIPRIRGIGGGVVSRDRIGGH